MITFDRDVYFDLVRQKPFGGKLGQGQVDGQEAILTRWEENPLSDDLRWLAYALATTLHETASEMLPIEEYGKGAGMKYGTPDPTTKQIYYGRGFVQCTWRENYARADRELGLTGDRSCEWHAENQLDPSIAAETMFRGMAEGWFRTHADGKPETLARYFNDTTDDPYGAREIINGDKTKVPSWSGGKSIGKLIAGYHADFLAALDAAVLELGIPPELEPTPLVVTLRITVPPGVVVKVEQVDG